MSLTHEFATIEKGSNKNFIDSSMNAVSISDELILYINDSLCWIDTFWNGNEQKKGLSYYGYTRIEGKSVDKLKYILDAWIALFDIAPNDFTLKGNYLSEENKYEKIICSKKELLSQLESLRSICVNAANHNMDILHNGI